MIIMLLDYAKELSWHNKPQHRETDRAEVIDKNSTLKSVFEGKTDTLSHDCIVPLLLGCGLWSYWVGYFFSVAIGYYTE